MCEDLLVTMTQWLIFPDGLLAALVWGWDQKSIEEYMEIKDKVCGCCSVRMFWSNSSPPFILHSFSIYSTGDSEGHSLLGWRMPWLCLQCYHCKVAPDRPRRASPPSPKLLCWHRKKGLPSGSSRAGRFFTHPCSSQKHLLAWGVGMFLKLLAPLKNDRKNVRSYTMLGIWTNPHFI